MSVDNRPATVAWAPTGVPTPEGWEEWQPRHSAELAKSIISPEPGEHIDRWTRTITTTYTIDDMFATVSAWLNNNPLSGDMLNELPEYYRNEVLNRLGYGTAIKTPYHRLKPRLTVRSSQDITPTETNNEIPTAGNPLYQIPANLVGTTNVGDWSPQADIWLDPWTGEEWTGPVVDGHKPIDGGVIRAPHGTPLPKGVEPYQPPAGQNRTWLINAPFRIRSFTAAYREWNEAHSSVNLLTVLRAVSATGRVAVSRGRALTIGEFESWGDARVAVERGRYGLDRFAWLPDSDRLTRVVEVVTPDGRETFADEDFETAFNVALRIAKEETQ